MSSESEAKTEKTLSPRERILAVAGPLFWAEGYRATGIDRVIAESGVAKATFYKHFPSKDDLMVAWIERAEAISQAGLPPLGGPEPLMEYVRTMLRWARAPGCLGCTWQGSAAEYRDPHHPVHRAALAVKQRSLRDIEARALDEGHADPKAVAERVFLFLEGVWAIVRMFGPDAPLDGAEAAIARLVR